jgi:hypothetical protein
MKTRGRQRKEKSSKVKRTTPDAIDDIERQMERIHSPAKKPPGRPRKEKTLAPQEATEEVEVVSFLNQI